MKIVCRTVTGVSTPFEVEPTETVGNIKQRMAGEYDLASLRLCHKGKVLDDAKSMADLGFNDGEVLIIAGKKAKPGAAAPAPASAPAPAAPAPAAPAETAPAPAPAPAQPAEPSPAAPAQPAEPAPAQPAEAPPAQAPAGDAPLPPGVDAGSVEFIMGMGFPDKPAVVHALRCAFGNADRAVEYLVSGIPPGIEAQFRQAEAQAATPQARPGAGAPAGGAPAGGAPAGGAPAGGAPAGDAPSGQGMSAEQLGNMMAQMQQQQQGGSALRRALAGIPQFEQIRALVRQNSAALPTVMQQLQQHHPQAFELVQANPQEFLELINEAPAGGAPAGGAPGGAPAGGPGGDGGAPEPLTEADQPAIERLVALGGGAWDTRAAAIVYMVCRKNEELAANVLFDNNGLPPELIEAINSGAVMGGDGGDSDDDEPSA